MSCSSSIGIVQGCMKKERISHSKTLLLVTMHIQEKILSMDLIIIAYHMIHPLQIAEQLIIIHLHKMNK